MERQARALAARGVEVDVGLACDLRRAPPPPAAGGPRVQVLDRRRLPFAAGRYDWVHLHSLRLAGLALEIRRRFGVPLAYTVHGFPQLERLSEDSSIWSRVQRRLLATSDRVVFLSDSEIGFGLRLAANLRRSACKVPNGVGPASPPPSGRRARGPIVFAGRFARSKGMGLLGRIVECMADEVDRRFVIAGGHGDRFGARVAHRLTKRFPGRCHFPGWLGRRAMDRLFARAALVLVPSRYEPFGLVAVEAMRMGTPVLAADVGGLRETVATGSGGHLLGSRRAEGWSGGIREILADERRLARLRRSGPAFVAAKFGMDRVAGLLLDRVYDPAGGGRRATRLP